ncbi:MAG TPA: cadherin-like beta sandwich domain-containing protein [Candidatus Avidehalobacter gallistercoris]|uniref:Cadherin-like beta sandwich domain-containing protein n=1 Tax=Candidatus Avidehalobacter gallistercoris TaxID=2840694 RepID=A0A9D1HIM9_9FIRM|nr:cadherin-like beta sandwich domain-containing protein [Candidatus Avidehalobacter gallistercoris]
MFKRKSDVFILLVLACTLFLGLASVAAADTYDLDRIDLYDYYDSSSRVRITSDDLERNMEKTVEWRRVKIVPRVIDGSYTVTGEVNQDSSDDYYVALDEGETIRVTINVYDDDGDRQERYYLDLTRGMEGIESVLFTADDFEKEFTSLDDTNKLVVPLDVDKVKLKAYLTDSDYEVECNDSGSSNNTWNISVPKSGTVSVYLNVYNEDDDEVAEYKFVISRSSSASSSAKELLDDLTAKNGSDEYEIFPNFDENVQDYYICLPSNVKSVTLTPEYGDDCDTVKINGKTVRDGDESSELSSSTGGSSYTMKITDEDGDTEEYTLNIVRAIVSSGSTAALDNLRIKRGSSKTESSLSEIEADPGFDSYTYDYELIAGDDSAYFSFRPSLDDSDGIALLAYGDTVIMLEDDDYCTPIRLESDETVTIRSYSPSFKVYKDYDFEIVGRQLDDTDTLEDLELYVDGVQVTISPSFNSKTYTYKASVSDAADVYTVTPTAEDSSATITVNGDTVKSGRSSDEYSLADSFTNVVIMVTAENGDSNTYRLTIDRSGSTTEGDPVKVVLRIGSTSYIVNGQTKQLSSAPYINSSRTQVPLRVIAEALGANVYYNSTAKQITISKDGERMYMDIGKVIKDFDVAPEIKANTTFVPIRYVSEKLQCECKYNNASKEVIITYNMDDDD